MKTRLAVSGSVLALGVAGALLLTACGSDSNALTPLPVDAGVDAAADAALDGAADAHDAATGPADASTAD